MDDIELFGYLLEIDHLHDIGDTKSIGVRSCNNTFYLIRCFHGKTFTN